MDPALLALATSSANALVSLMTTDLWERAKSGVSSIFSRRSTSQEHIDEELDESQNELTASSERGDLEDTTTEMQQVWKGKFRRLLLTDPEAAEELRAIIALWAEVADDSKSPGGINQTATAFDNSRIYQQGTGVQYNN